MDWISGIDGEFYGQLLAKDMLDFIGKDCLSKLDRRRGKYK